MDDNRKHFDHKRDFKRNVSIFSQKQYILLFKMFNFEQDSGSNVKKSGDDNYETDRNDKKESFAKVSKYHSRDSLGPPEDLEKDV